jgi:hypothetical protein
MTKKEMIERLQLVIECLKDTDEKIDSHYDCKSDLQSVIDEL